MNAFSRINLLKVQNGRRYLKISYVGFTTQTIDVGSQTNLSVRMSSDESLSEVVVTAAGVKRSSRSVGYALSSVSAKEITEGGDRSVLNGMQGKVAGVTINSASSNPGASSRIVIRGVQSISQGNQPLIVIDGVPMTNSSRISGATFFMKCGNARIDYLTVFSIGLIG